MPPAIGGGGPFHSVLLIFKLWNISEVTRAPKQQPSAERSTHTGQKAETVQVVMATPGRDRAGPPSCAAGGLSPPSLLKVCFRCPFRIMLGWLLGDPT